MGEQGDFTPAEVREVYWIASSSRGHPEEFWESTMEPESFNTSKSARD